VRFQDLLHRGALGLLSKGTWETGLFVVEALLTSALPIGLLLVPRVRQSPKGLYLASVLCLLGFVTNRMNVAITGMEAASGQHYFPKWTEIIVTLATIGVGFFVFAVAAKYLPIFSQEVSYQSVTETEVASAEVPELSHAQP
jgi:Ni/Fe-hydrogenase subunit HybB-like protein